MTILAIVVKIDMQADCGTKLLKLDKINIIPLHKPKNFCYNREVTIICLSGIYCLMPNV